MRIALDAHTLGSRVGGNETYIRNLILALQAIDKKNNYFLYHTNPEALTGVMNGATNFHARKLSPKNPLIRIPFSTPARLREDKVDLALFQYIAPPVCPAPYVLVIHDISYEHYPQYFKKLERLRLRMTTPVSARRAAHIITCSENSKKDLIRFYSIAPDKITVIYYGKNESFRPVDDQNCLERVRAKYQLPEKYILYVGNIQPRKNLPRLIEAYSHLKTESKIPQKFVVVGNKAWLYSGVFDLIRRKGLENEIIVTGYVPDEDLPVLYAAADVAVYPSIFEGFGFPVLEAMACGTPVVTSNTSSIPEVAGDAAVLVNPLSTDEIASGIQKVLYDDGLRASLREKGLKRAAMFNWDATARQTLEVFKKCSG